MQCLNKNCDGHLRPICDKCEYTGWIKVKEQPPENNEDIEIIVTDGETVCAAAYHGNNFYCAEIKYHSIRFEPTHWMPLPLPPKNKNDTDI